MRARLTTAIGAAASAAALALTLSGCGSSSASPDQWSTPEDVTGALESAGITCRATGEATVDTSSQSKGYDFVACDDFGVVLIIDKETFDATDKGNCTRLDDTFWTTAGAQPIVVGEKYRIASVTPDGTFPASLPAAKFASAFGGEATTLGDYYSKVCQIAKPTAIATPSATPTP